MGTVLVLIGFFAFIAAIVMLIISFIKKNDLKKWLKVMGISFIVLIVGGVLMPSTTENEDNQVVNAEVTATPEVVEPIETEEVTENEITEDEVIVVEEELTMGQKNALKKAGSYLDFMAYSYKGLITQLEFEDFTTEEATYGADNCGADWNEQALKKAGSYLEFTAYSYEGLIEQLEFEDFTTEQATYGADNCGADWNEQAVKKAESYLDFMSYSRSGLIEQLEFEGFTTEQATYGVEQNGY